MKRIHIKIRALAIWAVLLFSLSSALALGQQSPPAPAKPSAPTGQISQPADSNISFGDFAPQKVLKDIWADQKVIWSSPVRMNRHQWLSIALPLAAGTAALLATDERAMQWLPNTPGQVNRCRRISNIGVYSLGGIMGGAMLVGKKKGDSELLKVGITASEALLNSLIVNTSLKFITARERPLENNGEGRFWKGGDSFPSGHTMYSFAMAVVIARNLRTPKWLKVTSLGVATAVGFARWGAERHFPSDVLVGGVLGGLIGNFAIHQSR